MIPSPLGEGEGEGAIARRSHLQEFGTTGGVAFARELRSQSTDAERLLWSKLRSRQLNGWKYRRQVPMGRYTVDFLCEDARLIIELDGGQHADAVAYDDMRSRWLNENGYQVVRFWNNDVLNNIAGILESLTLTPSQGRGDIKSPLVQVPSPLGGG